MLAHQFFLAPFNCTVTIRFNEMTEPIEEALFGEDLKEEKEHYEEAHAETEARSKSGEQAIIKKGGKGESAEEENGIAN